MYGRCSAVAEGKYKAQQKYNRKHYVRFPLDLKPEVLEAFRAACQKNGSAPTTEIKRFIEEYIRQSSHGPEE